MMGRSILYLVAIAGLVWGGEASLGAAGEAMREVWTQAICSSSVNQTKLDEEVRANNDTDYARGMIREKCKRCFLNVTSDQVLTKYGGEMSMNCSRSWLGEEYEECNQLIQDGNDGNDVLACFHNTLYKVETSKCLEDVDDSSCYFCSTSDADRFIQTADCMKNKVRQFKKYMRMMVVEKVIGDSGCGFPTIIGMRMMAGMQRGAQRMDVDDFIDSLMEDDMEEGFVKPNFRPPIKNTYGRPKGPYYNQNWRYNGQNGQYGKYGRPYYNQNRPYYNQNRPYYNQNRPYYNSFESYDKRLPREYYDNEGFNGNDFNLTEDGWVIGPSGFHYKTGDLDYGDICSEEGGCSWSQAREVCKKEGGFLAVPTNQEEARFVARMVGPWRGKSWFYIGLSDSEEEGHWSYEGLRDVEAASFTNWFGNEPNSYNGMDEDCAFVSPNHGGGWGDIGCDTTSIPAWGLTMLPLCQREEGNQAEDSTEDLMDLFG